MTTQTSKFVESMRWNAFDPLDMTVLRQCDDGVVLETLKGLLGEEKRQRASFAGAAAFGLTALAVARCYAMLGMTQDAEEWFFRARQWARRANHTPLALQADIVQLEFVRRNGDYPRALFLGAALWRGRAAHEDALEVSEDVLLEMAQIYARLGQLPKANACLRQLTLEQLRARDPALWGKAQLLSADLLWWEALTRSPNLRDHVALTSDPEFAESTVKEIVERAYVQYRELTDDKSVTHRLRAQAQAGILRSRSLLGFDPSLMRELEEHWAWINSQGAVFETDLARLQLGVLYLMHDDYRRAQQWFTPLASAALQKTTRNIGDDVLYYSALALERGLNDRQALMFLRAYLKAVQGRKILPNFDPEAGKGINDVDDFCGAVLESSSNQLLIRRVCAHVKAHIEKPLTIGQIASTLGVSRRTLEYSFKRDTGMTPKRFLTSIRINEARERMAVGKLHTRRELARIAEQTGFPNYRAFARALKARASPLGSSSYERPHITRPS